MSSKISTTPTFSRMDSAPNLVDQVGSRIREYIMAEQLEPGVSLPSEGKLAEQFGVSRTVIREAMNQLRFAGLVEVSHGRRPRVQAPSPQSSLLSLVTWMQRSELAIHQILEVRRPIECEIARLAARHHNDELLNDMQNSIDALDKSRRLQDRIKADAAFHRALAEATGNPIFTLLLDAMSELLHEQRSRTLKGSGTARAVRDHQAILTCITSGDDDASIQAMQQHLAWPRQ